MYTKLANVFKLWKFLGTLDWTHKYDRVLNLCTNQTIFPQFHVEISYTTRLCNISIAKHSQFKPYFRNIINHKCPPQTLMCSYIHAYEVTLHTLKKICILVAAYIILSLFYKYQSKQRSFFIKLARVLMEAQSQPHQSGNDN